MSETIDRTTAERNALADALSNAHSDIERLRMALELERRETSDLREEIRTHAKWAEQFWKNPEATQAQELVRQLGTVYAVVYSNYSPAEMDSLWRLREKAEARARELGSPWAVEMWTVA